MLRAHSRMASLRWQLLMTERKKNTAILLISLQFRMSEQKFMGLLLVRWVVGLLVTRRC